MPTTKIFQDLSALSHAAAALFLEKAQEAIASHGSCRVLLSGGDTPRLLYEILARPPYSTDVPWSKLEVFWSDERWAPADSLYSNQGMAAKLLLNHVPIPAGQIHAIAYSDNIHQTVDDYEALLHSLFPNDASPTFDLAFLGLGSDGHTASLFPDAGLLPTDEHWVYPVFFDDPDLNRITLMPNLLNRSALTVFLVSGAGKAEIMQRFFTTPPALPLLPAQWIQPLNGKLYWLLDEAAASLLPKEKKD